MHDKARAADTVLARVISGLLAALLVLTALISLVLFNVERQAFNPETYKRALVSEGFYGKSAPLLGDLLTRDFSGNAPAFPGHLSSKQWVVLIEAVLPREQLQVMTEDALDQFFAYLNGETDTPRISLIPLKKSLSSPAGLDAALSIIRSQPDCTVQEIVRILISFGGELCNPPPAILELLQPVIHDQLQTAASVIPNDITLLSTKENTSLHTFRKDLKIIRLFMRLSPVVPLALLFTITVIAVRTFKSWLIWWGWPFLLTGLFGILLGFTGAPLFHWLIERWLSESINQSFPPDITASIRAVVDTSLREILKPVAWESLVLFIIGSVMVLRAHLMNRDKDKVKPSKRHFPKTYPE